MPYEGENHYDVKFGYIDSEGFHEVAFIREQPIFGKDEDPEENPVKEIAESYFERYSAFIEAGFDSKQAFSLTRDWFKSTLEGFNNVEKN